MTPVPTEVTPAPETVQVTAAVFQELPMAPMVMYHRFIPGGARSEKYKVSLSDLDRHLQGFYDAGYSLVALEDWLRGDMDLPEGRRPLIITIDDLFYADQIFLDDEGQAAPYSGIGRIWQFYQEHPDFNFHLALFYNMGDKGYANRYVNGSFYIESGWQEERAKAIAWCIENGALPYNHFFNHPNLSQLTPDQILWQLEENEAALREALSLVGKPELAKSSDNILALPYVIWPETDAGKQVLFDYQSPEGKPVAAILEANDGAHVRPILPPFSKSYDPHHVKRLNAVQEAIDAIIQKAGEIPTAAHCDLGEIPVDALENPFQMKQAILKQIRQGNCTNGYYTLGQFAFYVEEENVIQLSP
ncbi:MAG: Putative xylanase/chitin deacetylase [Anaerolineaceae bacterium 46_22]|nr:MAG: Putative xylanase/chitin deacetylase [Anaerolineaceae bacterium 46_22]